MRGHEGVGQQQVERADIEHLHDRRRLLCPIGGDGVLQRGVIGALRRADDFVTGLRCVEALTDLFDDAGKITGEAVPQVEFHPLGECAAGKREERCDGAEEAAHAGPFKTYAGGTLGART